MRIEGHEGEIKTILENQPPNYTRFLQSYRYPSIVNKNTDIDVWKAKASRAKLEGDRIKFRAQEHTTVISESCPDQFDASSICVYLKRVMVAKIRFELHSDVDFPVIEEMFKQIWLERLKEDKGYGETLRHAVKSFALARTTVADLMESVSGHLQLTSDTKALANTFNHNGQGTSEKICSYIFRKQQESRTIMLDGHYEKRDLVKTGIRGMREEEALKHRLLRKFRENQIKNFVQLKSQVEAELLEYKEVSTSEPTEQINYTSGFQTTPPQQRRRFQYDQP